MVGVCLARLDQPVPVSQPLVRWRIAREGIRAHLANVVDHVLDGDVLTGDGLRLTTRGSVDG